jgi:hypothetical protein
LTAFFKSEYLASNVAARVRLTKEPR